ncbi:MAG TPA: SRPBCC family protein [Thermoanaerobaculia bacterium]|nr:SRPBCC family protein [Thermoanaerobaculia bacterium]
MALLECQIEIARPVEEVFDFVADLRTWPRWIINFRVPEAESPRLAMDSTFRIDFNWLGQRAVIEYRISELDRPYRLTWTEAPAEAAEPSHPRSITYLFEPTGGGTRFTSRQEVRPGEAEFFGCDEALFIRTIRRYLDAGLETLKDLLEHPPAPPPAEVSCGYP